MDWVKLVEVVVGLVKPITDFARGFGNDRAVEERAREVREMSAALQQLVAGQQETAALHRIGVAATAELQRAVLALMHSMNELVKMAAADRRQAIERRHRKGHDGTPKRRRARRRHTDPDTAPEGDE